MQIPQTLGLSFFWLFLSTWKYFHLQLHQSPRSDPYRAQEKLLHHQTPQHSQAPTRLCLPLFIEYICNEHFQRLTTEKMLRYICLYKFTQDASPITKLLSILKL